MTKKMCRYYKVTSAFGLSGGILKAMECKKIWPKEGGKCPSNTNSKCEIITKKKVRISAWALVTDKDNIFVSLFKSSEREAPCIIEIEDKWLKEKK